MSEPESKFCKDCNWCHTPAFFKPITYRFAECGHPSNVKINPVSGENEFGLLCLALRTEGMECGPEGKNWESK